MDEGGAIKEVRFYMGGNLIGVVTNAPYEIVCSPSQRPAGDDQTLSAMVVDNEGASATSNPVSVGFSLHIEGNQFELLDAK